MTLVMPARPNIERLLKRRNISTIPRDQQKLLEGDNSWAAEVGDAPNALVHVPGHVLQTVTDAFIARTEQAREEQAGLRTTEITKETPLPDTRQTKTPEPAPASSAQEPSTSPERSISWPQSPPAKQHDGPPFETLEASHESSAILSSPPPPATPSTTRPAPNPPSSEDEDEDMPLDLPQAIEQPRPSVNMAAVQSLPIHSSPPKPDSTKMPNAPSCAQTAQQAKSTGSSTSKRHRVQTPRPAENPRPRRMKPILMSDSPSVDIKQKGKPPVRSPSRVVRNAGKPESSRTTPSTPLTPCTNPDPSLMGVNSTELNSNAPAVAVVEHGGDKIIETVNEGDSTKPQISHAEQPAEDCIMPTTEIAVDQTIEPYLHFTRLYPSYVTEYNGTFHNFVKACICLEYLLRELRLRDCLYDDFIRAFSGGYLSYVNNAGPHREPLPALEWFNNLKGPIIYTSMAVTEANIRVILQKCSEEVTKVRSKLKHGEEKLEEQPQLSSSPVQQGTSRPAGLDGAMDVDEQDTEEAEEEMVHETPARISSSPPIQREVPFTQPEFPLTQPPVRHAVLLTQSPIPLTPEAPPIPTPTVSSTPTSSVAESGAPRPSQYFKRLASSSGSGSGSGLVVKRRSAAEQARLREHFRKRKSIGARSTASNRAGS